MAVLYKADGTVTPVHPASGAAAFTLAELQATVGGWIEVVRVGGSEWLLVVNEEGLIEGLPDNVIATAITGARIVGDAVLCSRAEMGE